VPYPHVVVSPLLLLPGQQLINPPVLATATSTWDWRNCLEYLVVINVLKSKSTFLQLLKAGLEASYCWDPWRQTYGFVIVLCWSCTMVTHGPVWVWTWQESLRPCVQCCKLRMMSIDCSCIRSDYNQVPQ